MSSKSNLPPFNFHLLTSLLDFQMLFNHLVHIKIITDRSYTKAYPLFKTKHVTSLALSCYHVTATESNLGGKAKCCTGCGDAEARQSRTLSQRHTESEAVRLAIVYLGLSMYKFRIQCNVLYHCIP